jgi:hypothetical protein
VLSLSPAHVRTRAAARMHDTRMHTRTRALTHAQTKVFSGDVSVCEMLVEKGADLGAVDVVGDQVSLSLSLSLSLALHLSLHLSLSLSLSLSLCMGAIDVVRDQVSECECE